MHIMDLKTTLSDTSPLCKKYVKNKTALKSMIVLKNNIKVPKDTAELNNGIENSNITKTERI